MLKKLLEGMEDEIPMKKKKSAGIEIELEAPEMEEEDSEMGSEEETSMDEESEDKSPMAEFSDEDLLADLERRGLDVSALRSQLKNSKDSDSEM
jgi:hypothetical protein